MVGIFLWMFSVIVIVLILYVWTSMKLDFFQGYQTQEKNLIKEIENLEDFETKAAEIPKVGTKNVMIPDCVNIKKSNSKSTQNIDCKQYTITTNNKPEKIVVGNTSKKNDNFNVNINVEEISDDNNNEDDDPIKFL